MRQVTARLDDVGQRGVVLAPRLLVQAAVDLRLQAGVDQLLEVLFLHRSALGLEHETILEGGQLPLLGQLVGGGEQDFADAPAAACRPGRISVSLMIVSRMLRMAEFDLKISSRNASRAVGSLPCSRRM